MKKFFSKEKLIGFVIVAALFRIALIIGDLGGTQKLELSLTDARYRRYQHKFELKNSPVVVVDIDDESYDALFAVWPWARSYYAKLIQNLNRAGARAIGIDVMLDKARPDYKAEDDSLAKVLSEVDNVILAAGLNQQENMGGITLPYSKFLQKEKRNWGLINISLDLDGIVREYCVNFMNTLDSTLCPSLAARLYEMVKGKKPEHFKNVYKIAYPGGKKTFLYRPFYQVIDDSTFWTKDEKEWEEENNWFDTLLAEGVFKDKIVLVGASLQELHDLKTTPFSASTEEEIAEQVPGVEVHAAALHTLLNDYIIHDANPYIYYCVLVILCFIIYLLGSVTHIWIYLPAVILSLLTWFGISFKLFNLYSILLPITTPVLTILMVSIGQQGYLFYLEQQSRKKITGMFGQYVPKEVVKDLIKDPGKMKLGGERRELSTLFSDVAGFTTISEKLSPEQLVELLNEYLTAMTEIVHENGGIIDKYEGDAIMAEFGIPISLEDHAIRACRTAFSMQKRLHELRDKWKSEGRPELSARVGIGSGEMVFGNMGSSQSFDYTVMGDVVNLSSRLEGANKQYGTKILINERTYELCGEQILAREMDLLRVKGKNEAVKCFHLMATGSTPKADQIKHVINIFTTGVYLYRKQEWQQAIEQFKDVLGVWNDDYASQMYIERCENFAKNPPGDDWDGVYTMTSK